MGRGRGSSPLEVRGACHRVAPLSAQLLDVMPGQSLGSGVQGACKELSLISSASGPWVASYR